MAYKFQIGKFKTAGEIDVSEGDIELNENVVDNSDLSGGITSDKMEKFEDGEIVFSGEDDAFVSSETAKFNMDTEIAARIAQGDQLAADMDSMEDALEAADANLQSNITAEVNRAQAAEGVLDAKIDQEIADRISAVATEAANRVAATDQLASDLDSEVDDLEARMAALGGI